MLYETYFTQNHFDLMTTESNRQLAKILLSNGASLEKVNKILMCFFSDSVMLREIFKHANNPEATEMRLWRKAIDKQYDKAIRELEVLLSNDLIPAPTKETIIQKDIEKLQNTHKFLTMSSLLKTSIKPNPASLQQMIIFQSWALYKYLKNFKGQETDNKLYDFISELLKNIYNKTLLAPGIKKLNGNLLKKNFIDNAGNLPRKKYNELEKVYDTLIK